MSKAFITTGIVIAAILGVVFIVGVWLMGTYNGLVTQNEGVTAAWSQVETQYQRRFDLVPNLVEATKGTMKQEQAVFGAIAEARTHYANAKQSGDVDEQVGATQQYESALARLMVVMENYPVLRSIDTVNNLMDELSGTENRVAVARDRFNTVVLTYNNTLIKFPTNVIGTMFGFEKRAFFESTEGADEAPKVNLDTK